MLEFEKQPISERQLQWQRRCIELSSVDFK